MRSLHTALIYFIALFLLILHSPQTLAAGGTVKLEVKTRALGVFQSSSWEMESGKKANFSGNGFGFQLEALSRFSNYGLGFSAGYLALQEKNSASKNDLKETYTDQSYFIGGKFYAAKAFLGIYLTSSEVIVESKLDAERRSKYSGFGLRSDLGMDFYLGKAFSVSPAFVYQIRNMKKTGSLDAPKVETVGGQLSLNLEF